MICIAATLCAIALTACASIGYSGKHAVPDATRNEVLFIERNRLSFALGMEIDERDVIEKCNCVVSDGEGDQFTITAEMLGDGKVEYESFDLENVGSNKQIRIAYHGAVNYIYYDVNDYTANFYLDKDYTELYKTVKAQAQLTDTLGLAVWVNLVQYNFSTDELMREYDADRAMSFDGWCDSAGNRATGLYTLAPPLFGNEREINFHARYLTEAEMADLKLSYDNSGRRVFSGYVGSNESVRVPEGVTYIDFAEMLKDGCTFKNLYVSSTANIGVPFLSGIKSYGLETITVDSGNLRYASYNGALYSKDYSTLYFMPSDCKETTFHTELSVIESYACAYWRVTELEIPEDIATLQNYCFAHSLLENVRGLENVKTIKTGVFFDSQMKTFTDGNIAEYIALSGENSGKYILSMMLDETVTEYKLIDGTIGIAGDAFGRCKSLTSVDLGDDLISIGSSAFEGCSSLESVRLPASLKKMGSSVFNDCTLLKSVEGLTDVTFVDDDGNEYEHTLPTRTFRNCTALRAVTLPDGLVNIAPSAFYNCRALNGIKLPDTVSAIGDNGFYGCSGMKSMELPKGLRRLGQYAFGASGLETIDLSVCKQLTSLPDYCFRNCKQLKAISIPDNITAIPYRCFYTATALASVTLGNVTVIEDEAFAGCTALPNIDLNGVESIGYQAFQQCNLFVNFVLPDSVRRVGGYAFRSCARLESLTLGTGVQDFGYYTYEKDGHSFDASQLPVYTCRKLREIKVADGNPYFKSIDGVLYGREICGVDYGEGSILYCVPIAYAGSSFESAETTRIVAPYALHYQTNLTAAKFNEGLENIGKAAFYYSGKLQSVSLPSTVKHIGAGILLSCAKVNAFSIDEANATYSSDGNLVYTGDALIMYLGLSAEVNIKAGVTAIESAVFMNNAKITEIVIPDSVTAIGEKAFSGCSKIEAIHIGSGLKSIDTTAFALLQSLNTITVSEDNPYFTAENNILYTKDGKSLILAAAGNGMTELNIKDGVTEIWDYAFSYHKTLKSVVLPHTVKTIGNYSFYECRGVEYLYCSESLESIGTYAFAFDLNSDKNFDSDTHRCSDALKTILFYGNLKSIGDFAFNGQFGIEFTFYKMTVAELTTLLSGVGANSVYFTLGCRDNQNGGYYNNHGFGIIRALYSATEPTIDVNGYEWFYLNEDGTPAIYQQIPGRRPA
ncbi:MAG: leucine-rich repeat domain-containing protein [Clostridiales bacterium]|nr:leucine-rich repeat domain-containing protein [Clostridiales bacterium]